MAAGAESGAGGGEGQCGFLLAEVRYGEPPACVQQSHLPAVAEEAPAKAVRRRPPGRDRRGPGRGQGVPDRRLRRKEGRRDHRPEAGRLRYQKQAHPPHRGRDWLDPHAHYGADAVLHLHVRGRDFRPGGVLLSFGGRGPDRGRGDTYEATHDYDEYHFDLDEIEHDPYVLLSILSALHEGVFTLDEVQGDLEMLFEKQYILTETVTTETRYRTETRTDSEGNEYEVEVPYTWYICTVTLENFNLSHVPVYIMGEDQLSMYAVYMSTLGNRPDLFPSSGYVGKYIENPPTAWDIPAEYLTDERFATLITEAEKYLGYPYVWGGSSPETSFDCSGFVSYVLTSTGLCNTGRLGAQGLYNISTPVSDPQPGDLVFFVGTYDTSGISHVGIYVGDGMMLHCGDPISYTNLNTSYWQSHFYAYGRPPYN